MRAWLHRVVPWLVRRHQLVPFELVDPFRTRWQGVRCTGCAFVDDSKWIRLPPSAVETRTCHVVF